MIRGLGHVLPMRTGCARHSTIHVPHETDEVWLDVQSGRLDPMVGLDPDVVEFWLVISDATGRTTRSWRTSRRGERCSTSRRRST